MDEVNGRDRFLYVFIIFMPVVMKGNRITIIAVYSGSCDNRPAKITADISDDCLRVTEVRFCINIETVFMVVVAFGFYLFERRADDGLHFIQECGTESIAQKGVVKVSDMTPKSIITKTAFGDETVDMRIPFGISAKSM